MNHLQEAMQQERQRLNEQRDQLTKQRAEIDDKIAEVDRELKAIDVYEQARTGTTGTKRRSRGPGVREQVLSAIKKHPAGIARADLLEALEAKGDKRAEQSISNALASLKKSGAITADNGQYRAAAAENTPT